MTILVTATRDRLVLASLLISRLLPVPSYFLMVWCTRHLGHDLWKARIDLLEPLISINPMLVPFNLLKKCTLVSAALRILLIISSWGKFNVLTCTGWLELLVRLVVNVLRII